MSAARWRRIGMVALIVLLGPLLLLALTPGAPGAVRIAGVSIAWWYAGLIGPVLAAGLATVFLARSPE
jgi:hypothetical protein